MVELALGSPLLIFCLAGAMDLARFFYTTTALTGAANAGVLYGVPSTARSADYTGMQNAATAAASSISGVAAAATQFGQGDAGNSSVTCRSGRQKTLSTYKFFQNTFPIPAVANLRFS